MARRIPWTALASLVLLALFTNPLAARVQADGQLTIAFDASIAPTFLDPADTAGLGTPFVFLYALRVVAREPGRPRVRVQAARGAPLSQRRPLHGRRCEVQLRALPWNGVEAPPRPREVGGRARPTSRAVHAPQAVAGLPRVLRDARDRSRVDRAQEVHREGRRGVLQAPADRPGALPLREYGPRPRASDGRQRSILS